MSDNLIPSASGSLISKHDKKAITPLLIVVLFLSLTEIVLGAAVTQTQGGIQVALTVFVICFPVLIATFFFLVLWYRPYVFYPPTEFGQHTNVSEYVEAMQRRPAILNSNKESSLILNKALSGESKEANEVAESDEGKKLIDELVEYFVESISLSGLIILYASIVAHSQSKSFNLQELCGRLQTPEYEYSHGILVACSSTGLVSQTESKGIINVTFVDEGLKDKLPAELDNRIGSLAVAGANDAIAKSVSEHAISDKKIIDEYFK
jgi:hypothetical protein